LHFVQLASWSAALDRQDHMMQDPRREYAGSYGGSYSRQYYMTGIVAQPPYVGKSAEELRYEVLGLRGGESIDLSNSEEERVLIQNCY